MKEMKRISDHVKWIIVINIRYESWMNEIPESESKSSFMFFLCACEVEISGNLYSCRNSQIELNERKKLN